MTPRPLFLKSSILSQTRETQPYNQYSAKKVPLTSKKRSSKKMLFEGEQRKSPTSFCARRPNLYDPKKKLSSSKKSHKSELFEITDLDMDAKPRGSSNKQIPHSKQQLALIKSSMNAKSPDMSHFGPRKSDHQVSQTTKSNTMTDIVRAQNSRHAKSGSGSSSFCKKEKVVTKQKVKKVQKANTRGASPVGLFANSI